tara:strand:+ start:1680 stop:2843 length:1164 start_codon:yes stop_codon:yes gene_type:complete
MSDVVGIETITDRAGTGAPDFTNGFNINGSDSGISPHKHTEGATEPSSPSNGDAWLDTDNSVYKVYIDGEWKDWLGTSPSTSNPWSGTRAVFGGGDLSSRTNVIQYVDTASAYNTSDFGDLTANKDLLSGAAGSSSSRGLFFGGSDGSTYLNNIDYITISTTGNAADFGDLNISIGGCASCSDGTRAFTFGGFLGGTSVANNIQQNVIATTGNATDFGDTSANLSHPACCSDLTRAVVAHGGEYDGSSTSYVNNLSYITTASAGNSTDFGDATVAIQRRGSASDSTRGIFCGGWAGNNASRSNVIDYITIQSAGNAIDFGDMTVTDNISMGACADMTKAFMGGGVQLGVGRVNIIEQITIQTPANATDFGDLLQANYELTAFSGNPS